jgi:ribonucleoside-diphosphate reductase alpha chain
MTDKYIQELSKSNMLNNYRLFNSTIIPINNDSFSRTYVYDFLNKFIYKYNLKKINLDELVDVITKGLHGDISANDFYNFVADQCVVKTSYHPEYNKLASKILAERLHKMTDSDILSITNILYNNLDSRGNRFPLLDDRYVEFVKNNSDEINAKLDFNKDYEFDYFGLRTLERSYLMRLRSYKKVDKKIIKEDIIIERPQHLFMRVALFIHLNDLEKAFETYDLLSEKYFTHATPTLFNAGTRRPQMSSCYLIACEDSMDSITETLSDVMQISKWAGGIGVHISSVRGDGSVIRGTNGISDGILGLCKGFNWASLYVNQGGKRNGSIAVYMEPYHSDIFQFCELRMNTGSEDKRCRDLFLALWIPDLFMERVESDEMWSLMCPDQCPNLNKVYGEEFNKLYEQYEREGKYTSRVPARKLFKHIMTCQSETGFPYMCYKDHANHKSNQKNLGTIRSSNLCAEVFQYSDENETAVCNLVSLCLPKYIKYDEFNKPVYDFEKLMYVTRVAVRNLNNVIDLNFYPTEKTKVSNLKNRPVGIGIQGQNDVYNMMGYGFDSPEAELMNKKIFECIYYAAVDESKELAKIHGPYQSFKGSPFSEGKLQYHLWGLTEKDLLMNLDWVTLTKEVKQYGTRNSLLTALMPTASTAQIMGNYEGFEPYLTNIFVRTTLAGEFVVINEHLVKDLEKLNLWNEDMRKLIIIYNGSVQHIDSIPANIKAKYKTAFELSLKSIIKQSIERGPFIDQSQSMNLFQPKPNFKVLYTAHMYGWKNGLKTGMYYLRTSPAVNPINFGIDIDDLKRLTGMSSVEELIQNSIADANIITNKRKRNENSNSSDNSNEDEPKQEEKPLVCRYVKGQAPADCLVCSS